MAMHGSPPRDFPREEMLEYFQLQAREHQHPPAGGHSSRFRELEARMRGFPRNETNDPFWKGSQELAAALERACGLPVLNGVQRVLRAQPGRDFRPGRCGRREKDRCRDAHDDPRGRTRRRRYPGPDRPGPPAPPRPHLPLRLALPDKRRGGLSGQENKGTRRKIKQRLFRDLPEIIL